MFPSHDVYVRQIAVGVESKLTTARRAYIAWGVALILIAFVLALVVGAPLASVSGYPLLAFSFYRAFAFLCHQIPERSFYLLGAPLAICARCWGLYAGFALGILCYPIFNSLAQPRMPQRRWLLLAAVPTSVDFLLGFSGVWENTHWSRALTGALLGAMSALYVMPGVLELGRRKLRTLFSISASQCSSSTQLKE